MDILEKIVAATRMRIEDEKSKESLQMVREMAINKALKEEKVFPFEEALKGGDVSVIGEVKKASPSKGIFWGNFPYKELAKSYEKMGVQGISVITEPTYFQGRKEYLQEIASVVKLPILRKDFVIDEYMIYQAKNLGAHAILLICRILTKEQLKKYIGIGDLLGLSSLVEVHSQEEIKMAIEAGARVIGVNNRDLSNFQVDINQSIRLRKLVPEGILFVSESGIASKEDLELLKKYKVDAALIGEAFVKKVKDHYFLEG